MAGQNATREEVARLFGRAAFGATATDLDLWSNRPYSLAVEHLLTVPNPATRPPSSDDVTRLSLEQSNDNGPLKVAAMQEWWLERMRTTSYPLEERMTLLWHDHFATATRAGDVPASLVFQQVQKLRLNAMGNFRTMAADLTVDAAMLLWLNGSQSTGGKPNENYAREFFELFTLGTHPQPYSETDVREAARVLTGWTVDASKKVAFVPRRHDTGVKRVLGATIANGGATEYTSVVDIALAQQVAPRFVAYKLVAGLAYQPATTDLLAAPDPLVRKVADSLRSSNWDIKSALRTLLLSDEFRTTKGSDGRRFVRSPVEVAVAVCKPLQVPANQVSVSSASAAMGQQLLRPPNVGGWPKGRRWLSSSTVVARYGWAVGSYVLWKKGGALRPSLPKPDDLGGWASFFGLAGFSSVTTAAVGRYLASRKGAAADELQAGVMGLVLTSPDWMVL